MTITSCIVLTGTLLAVLGAAIPQPPHDPQPSVFPSAPSTPSNSSTEKAQAEVSAWKDTIW